MTSLDDVPAELRDELAAAGLDPEALWRQVRAAVEEDLPDGTGVDPTSWATIADDATAGAVFGAREPGVVAGLGVAALVFHAFLGADVRVTDRLPDGTRVEKGDVVMRVSGRTRQLLVAERTALNLACHLSGVATATARWVEALDGSRRGG